MITFNRFKSSKKSPHKIKSVLILDQHGTYNELEESIFDFLRSKTSITHNRLSGTSKYSPEDENEITSYKKSSFALNAHLLALHHFGLKSNNDLHFKAKDTRHSLSRLDNITNRPIGHKVTVYSGLGFNPKDHINEDGHLHLPAYTSTSIDDKIARKFTNPDSESRHMLKLDLSEHDKGAYIGHINSRDQKVGGISSEKELLLPRGMTLKIHKSEVDKDGINIHHASIVHEVPHDVLEQNPHNLDTLHPNFIKLLHSEDETHPHIKAHIQEHLSDKLIHQPTASDISSLLDTDALHKASESPDVKIRHAVAKHDLTRPHTLHSMKDDKSELVRLAVASHPNTRRETLLSMQNDEDPRVKKAVLKHKNFK